MVLMLVLCGCGKKNEVAAEDNTVLEAAANDPAITAIETPIADNDADKSAAADSTAEEADPAEKSTADPEPSADEETSGEASAESDGAEPENAEESAEEAEGPKLEDYEIVPIDPAEVMYTNTGINVRRGPSTDFDKVGFLKAGTEIQITGKYKDEWYEIDYNKSKSYVSADYVVAEAPPAPDQAAEGAPEQAVADAGAAAPGDPTAPAENQPAAAQPAPAPAPEPAPAPAPAPVVKAPAGVLLIGDSRCVMMKAATEGGGVSWICENGKGYDWMMETALPQADAIVGKGTKVVFCLGVNDPEHAWAYAREVNAKAAQWAERGASTYYVSVNPVWENPYTTEDEVKDFNTSMASSLSGVKFINTHDTLVADGYRIVDGLHYDDETSRRIFNYIIGGL